MFSWFRLRGVSITQEGTYYFLVFIFILAGAIVRSTIPLLMILACMLLGPLLFNLWVVTSSLRNLRFTRRVPSLLSCDETFFVELTATNPSRRSTYAVVIEDKLEQIAGFEPEPPQHVDVFFAKIGSRDEAVISYKAVIRKRGKYNVGPLSATTAFPLGLMRSTRTDTAVTSIVVMPRLGHMTPAWRRIIQQEKSGFASSRRQHGLLEGDFYGLREFRNGDPKQWIHWRSSAKQGELVVRQFEKQNQQDFVLVIDAWLPDLATAEDKQRAETVISMAATAVRELALVGGCQLQLVCCGEESETIVGNVSQAYVAQAMHDLAVLVPTNDLDIGEAMANALRTSRPGSRVVLLTTRNTDLSDTEVFAAVWNDSKLRSELGRVKTVAAGRGDVEMFFHLPEREKAKQVEGVS